MRDSAGTPRSRSRALSHLVVAIGAAVLLALVPAAARADDASTVTVVGTSDVFDSNLIQSVIQPGFQAAYPQYHMNYVSKGTGAAIAYAEAGTASGLLVHAASLENQFVQQGYSNEPYGRAIFYGDYVLLGPASDPAGVMTGAPHDIVSAFEKIATAGAEGHARFISRGGTPGTTVAEHAIWALTQGTTLCTVSDANGGGETPSTAGGACQDPVALPGWYKSTGLTQAPNITNGDACNYSDNGDSSHDDCYVLTDRGTFNYLQSTHAISNLGIVVRDNDPAARGGRQLLINSFHAYAINPAKFAGQNVQINVPGMTALLNWITSPAGQSAIGAYLNGTNDAPFLPSASPSLTGSAAPATVAAGTPITIAGNLRNVVPSTPPLAGKTVTLTSAAGALASGTTDAAGNYSLTFTPTANGSFSVTTPQITQVEDATLNPIFGDLLAPASTFVGSTTVQSAIKVAKVTAGYRRATVSGTVAPAAGTVSITARKGNSGAFKSYAKVAVTNGTYSIVAKLPPGTWQLQAHYDNASFISSIAPTSTVKVLGTSAVRISKVKVSNGVATVTGALSPAPTKAGGYVRLLGARGKHVAKSSATAKLRTIGKAVKIAKGRKTFTIRTHLKRGYSWQLQVEYVHKGAIDTSHSVRRTVAVR